MECPAPSTDGGTPAPRSWLISFRVEGDVRFISHRDTLRMFQRAIARASLPARFSAGFNPHMKLAIPWPRPVGVASEAETLIVELYDEHDEAQLRSQIQTQMPAGITITDAEPLPTRKHPRPTHVRYRMAIDPEDADIVASKSRSILEASSLPIERIKHRDGRAHTFDARPFFSEMNLEDDALEFTLKVTDGTSPRPAEVATLLGLKGSAAVHRFRRLHIAWENAG